MDFEPPSGPPPPKVPAGWTARWNDSYKEWFYVNIYTKKSQWDKPTEAVYPPSGADDGAPAGPAPGYDPASSKTPGAEKGGLQSNNPYGSGVQPGPYGAAASSTEHHAQPDVSEDEKLARRLQEEEDARIRGQGTGVGAGDRGASDSYYGAGAGQAYGQQPGQGYDQQQLPARDVKSKGGLFSKLSSKLGGGSSSSRPPQQQYGGGGYQQQQQYGQQYGQQQPFQQYPPQQQYGGYPQQGYPPQAYGQHPPKRSGGMGTGGALALGAGGGLLGGMMLGEAMGDAGDDGGDYGGGDDGGGDYGGGDDGGGGDF